MADVSMTLAERGARYGSFRDHAELVEGFLRVLEGSRGWSKMDAVKRQGLRANFDKVARIANGDPEYADNWHDIQGYAKLVEDDLLDPSTPSGEFIKVEPVSATPPAAPAAPAPIPAAIPVAVTNPLPKITPPVVKS
jgi:hypothetical protein